MNPLESIQNKTNQVTEEFIAKIKKEIAVWIFTKADDLVRVILYIIFFLSTIVLFGIISIFLFFFKGITDFNGEITYGSTLVWFIGVLLLSSILSFFLKNILKSKYKQFKDETLVEFENGDTNQSSSFEN